LSGERLPNGFASTRRLLSVLQPIWQRETGVELGVVVGGGNIFPGEFSVACHVRRYDTMGMLATDELPGP
jgi:uridylate kinase